MACDTTTTTTAYTPITGILIRSSSLVEGFGCGTGSDQVYRYVATVDYAGVAAATPDGGATVQPSGAPWTNIFDCFTDGVFENLPSSTSGSQAFTVSIFAYDTASYEKAALPVDLGCPPSTPGNAAVCVPPPQRLSASQARLAPWSTTCSATQEQGIPVLAVCLPLSNSKTSAEAGAPDGATPDSANGTDAGTTSTDADTGG